MYIIAGDLGTHIYAELLEIITRGDSTVLDSAIQIGIGEAKAYLTRYDLIALFGDNTDPDNYIDPTVTDENLKAKVKDLICWHLIKLANPNIDLKLFRTGYEDAIEFFKMVQKSQLAPAGWVYKVDDDTTPFPEGNIVNAVSNIQRKNHW